MGRCNSLTVSTSCKSPSQQSTQTAKSQQQVSTQVKKARIEKWLLENSDKNLYFSVNPTKKLIHKKPTKNDVASMDWLHVDVDPGGIGDITKERAEILAKIYSLEQKPTIIIDSGNGYQAFYKLKQPVKIKSKEHWEELELYNRQLIILLGGDIGCFNIDRIMRLPFTINHPTKSKLKKGRKKAPTSVVEFNNLTYSLRDFKKGPPKGTRVSKSVQKLAKIKLVPIPQLFYDLLEFHDSLLARWNGSPIGLQDTSRSAFDFSMVALLKAEGFSTEETFAILKEFKYGKLAEEKDPQRYFERMWSRAKTPEDWMLEEAQEGGLENG